MERKSVQTLMKNRNLARNPISNIIQAIIRSPSKQPPTSRSPNRSVYIRKTVDASAEGDTSTDSAGLFDR